MLFVEESYSFSDVAIKQQKNIVKSRLDVDISSEIIRGVVRPTPLIAANMSSVIDGSFYKQLYSLGAFSFLHRAQPTTQYLEEVKDVAKNCEWVGASIGVGSRYKELSKELIYAGANVIIIDIAHGYSDEVINLGREIKKEFPHIKLVVGNTVNTEMVKEISDFADALKIGIGAGKACTTARTAGCTEHQWSVCINFKQLSKEYGLPMISCGGVREESDAVKAIAAGASSVMIGSVFAACPESAAKFDGLGHKIYYGMASVLSNEQLNGRLKPGTVAEGTIVKLELNDGVEQVIERYCGSLRSGITYAGGKDVKSMQENVKWVLLS